VSNLISRFTERVTFVIKRIADDWDEPAAPERGGGFTDAAMKSHHCLRIYLNTTYRLPGGIVEQVELHSSLPLMSGFVFLR